MRRTALVSALILLPIAAAAEPMLVATNGAVLPTPEITALDCEKRAGLLETYSDSDYRRTMHPPAGHPDRAIYEYEDRLADAFYRDCQVGTTHFESVAPVFSKGFN